MTWDFLTGQGRAAGDVSAVVSHQSIQSPTEGVAETVLASPLVMGLSLYTEHQLDLSVTIPVTEDSKLYNQYNFEIASLLLDTGTPPLVPVIGAGGAPIVLDSLPASVRLSRGRTTAISVFINDAILTASGSTADFNEPLFRQTNLDPVSGGFKAFYTDFVSFDISAVPNPPLMSSGQPAKRAFFSGDNYALSLNPTGLTGAFEELTALRTATGNITKGTTLGTTVADGTYSLIDTNPSDLTGLSRIMSLLGTWRDYTKVIANPGAFEVITFPGNEELPQQQMVLIARNGSGLITQCYFGTIDLSAKTFLAWPIGNLPDATVTNQFGGTVSSMFNRSGAAVNAANTADQVGTVRSGTLNIQGTLPAGVPSANVRFIVYRA